MASKPNTKDTMTKGKVKSESAGEYELTLKYDGFMGARNETGLLEVPRYTLEVEDSEGNKNEYGIMASVNAGREAINGTHIGIEEAVDIAMYKTATKREFGEQRKLDASEIPEEDSFMQNYLTHLEKPQNSNQFAARQYLELLEGGYEKRQENLEALGHETGGLKSQLKQATLENSKSEKDRTSISDVKEALSPF